MAAAITDVYLGGDTVGNDEEIDSPTQHDEEGEIRENIWKCEIIMQTHLNYHITGTMQWKHEGKVWF